jgi:hypothetical protein
MGSYEFVGGENCDAVELRVSPANPGSWVVECGLAYCQQPGQAIEEYSGSEVGWNIGDKSTKSLNAGLGDDSGVCLPRDDPHDDDPRDDPSGRVILLYLE